MGRSIRTWITDDLNTRLRDTSGSQTIWTFDEKTRAIQSGLREAAGYFRWPAVYNSLKLAPNQRDYALPPYVQHIRSIERELIPTTSASGELEHLPLAYWRQVQSQETNLLEVLRSYDAYARVHYERDVIIPPIETSMWTDMTSTQGFIGIANTAGYRRTEWAALLPFHAQIEGEVLRIEAVTATSFTGVFRGSFGTEARSNSLQFGIGSAHSSNQAISIYIPYEYYELEEFVTLKAMQQLYTMRLNDADAEASRTIPALAAEYGRQAEEQKKRARPFHLPRQMTFRLPRRL